VTIGLVAVATSAVVAFAVTLGGAEDGGTRDMRERIEARLSRMF